MKWYPVFLREMLLFRAKLFRLGYIFSSMFVPLLYLLAFGLGLGRSVRISEGTYLEFLLPGLVAMSSMTNSYNWVASGINLGRLYFKTFQVLVQAPIPPSAIVIGEVLSGMVRGLFASLMIILVGVLLGGSGFITPIFITALLINCFLFASLGVVVGMITKSHEDTSMYSNFFILPMAFFGGTFFPVEHMPPLLKGIVLVLPLTHTNILMRKTHLDTGLMVSLAVLVTYSIFIFLWGAKIVRDYNE